MPRPGRIRDRTYGLLNKGRITDPKFCRLLIEKGWTWVTLDRNKGIVVGRHKSEAAALFAAELYGGRPKRVPEGD